MNLSALYEGSVLKKGGGTRGGIDHPDHETVGFCKANIAAKGQLSSKSEYNIIYSFMKTHK